MNKIWILCFGLFLAISSSAQTFSANPDTFAVQARKILQTGGSNTTIVLDAETLWSNRINEEERQKIHGTVLLIQQREYNPRLARDFMLLTFTALSRFDLSTDQTDQLLSMNYNALESLNKSQYINYVKELSAYVYADYLHRGRNVRVTSSGGSPGFEMMGAVAGPVDFFSSILAQSQEEESVDSVASLEDQLNQLNSSEPEATDDGWDNVGDSWGQPAPWDNQEEESADDGWGNTQDWGNSNDDWGNNSWDNSNDDWGNNGDWDNSNDDWGNTNDDWGNSNTDDGWGNNWDNSDDSSDDSWGFGSEEPPAPERDAYAAIETDYVAMEKAKYRVPPIEGPVTKLDSGDMTIATRYDSLLIQNVSGTHMFSSGVFVGSKGTVSWPGTAERTRSIQLDLDEFYVKTQLGDFWTPNATMTFPDLFSDTISGSFRYRTVRHPDMNGNPVFSSHDDRIRLEFNEGKVTYQGGIEIRGEDLYGKSLDRSTGVLTILDGKGHTAIFRSQKFELKDSLITSPLASMAIYYNNDSINHPAVELEYYLDQNKIVALRSKQFDVAPFHSSFHGLAFGVDILKWDLNTDSIDFDIMNGKAMVPATFESEDFFSQERYARLTGIFGFHPIGISVGYAKKYRIRSFNVMDLVNEYDISEAMARGAMKMLHQYHFCEYDAESGTVRLDEKAFHYYESSARQKDYDNVFIPSRAASGPSATLSLDSGTFLTVRGVDKFYVTPNYKVSLMPDVSELKIGHDKDIRFHGEIDAGDFVYKGHEFHFDYEQFQINMDVVDSIAILMPIPDSLQVHGEDHRKLSNHLTETSGTLYLNQPDNRSGRIPLPHYPYFVSETEATVYFDGEEYLDGAYDRSVFFVIPPMQMDDIDTDSAQALIFPGSFQSGGIFPKFYDTLHIMPDQSLGFVHNIPDRGYNLYGTPAKTYETITISYGGIRGHGKIDFLKSSIYSEDFIYYPDSVTADGHYGTIDPGTVRGFNGTASYPQAELGSFRMYWLPRKDSMYLQTLEDPFSFYNATAQLTGKANITQGGVYGSGSMLTRGSIAESNEMSFEEFEYSARHAKFEVLSDDPEKPAMAGDDISLTFDLRKNVADVHPEQTGVAAISFPYAQMKTSITNAVWDLDDSTITMTKPENVLIEDSYFFTTREELDSLAFNAGQAIYDIKTYELNVKEIPYIEAADAKIIPEGNETTILANSVLQTFTNAELIFEYPEAYHYLKNGVLDIRSRNEFSGKATYQLPIEEDTFEIELHNFYLEERFTEDEELVLSSTASGEVSVERHLDIAPGFLYKGGVTLRVFKQALELDGYVQPDVKSISDHDHWITFLRTDTTTDVVVDMATATYEDGDKAIAGLHYGSMGKVYPSFIEKRISPADDDFFLAEGLLRFNPVTNNYIIENPGKASGEMYEGHTLIYNDTSTSITFEGAVNFIHPEYNEVKLKSAVLGNGNRKKGEYDLDAFLAFDFKMVPFQVMDLMAADLLDIVERLGNAVANDLSLELMLKMANIIGDQATRTYEENSLKDYIPLHEAAPALNTSLVISGVKMKWNDTENAWHNTTKLAVSNAFGQDINAKMDGFVEFKKDDTGGDVFNVFIQAAPGSWYYFNYQEESLLIYSSNKAFNEQIKERSNFGNTKPGELVLIAGEEPETLEFLNNFRKIYFGIDEPYNLVYPDDVSVEDESFDTIEEDEEDDDGFGF